MKKQAGVSDHFELIVIGAGINGAGVARDAAMRGLKVLLLDKGDIGGGTSSLSTRLIHGGLRYLEHGEVRLVRESLRERETLLRIAPHLVRPLELVIPIYKNARRGVWMVRAGMLAYEVLSGGKSLARYQMLSRPRTLEKVPGLEPSGLLGAAIYYDAQVEFAERLVLENVLSAMQHGAEVMTYARVGLTTGNEALTGINFTNETTGERSDVRASVVVNAAGPWVDDVLSTAGDRPTKPLIGGTKGSHIVVGHFQGAPVTAIYVEARTDHRPFFIIPWNQKYLIGTTDIRYEGDLDRVRIGEDEIDYLLGETNSILRSARLERKNILYSYSGVRPLPFTDQRDEQNITRRHFIRQHPKYRNLFSIVGGKLTTYRSLAEEVVDRVYQTLDRPSPKCQTTGSPLPGATGDYATFNTTFKQTSNLPERTNERLLRVYGVRAEDVLKLAVNDPSLASIFDSQTGAIAAEIVHAFKNELAQTLADCLLRRTMVGLNSNCGLEAALAAARIAQQHFGWTDRRVEAELHNYQTTVARLFKI
jgi:glycerol-3-phosphate dehydrogenase